MKEVLERLSKIQAPVCVTLILKTHKTHPENHKDAILLKNLISEANRRLTAEYDTATAERFTKKLQNLANQIDHRYNDNGLMLFVNDEIEEFIKLPTNVNTRVILDDTFATRSIIRALKKDTEYYVLMVNKGRARLLQASSDALIEEDNTEFPIENKELFGMAKAESSISSRVTNLTQEFFNQVDKAVNRIRKENPIPVVIFSDETNYHQYMKEADFPNTILGNISLKNMDEKASNLVKDAWETVKELTVSNNRERISELDKALNSGNYLGDINEIWSAVQEGKGKTIFVEEGYYQPVKNENGILTPITSEEISKKEDVDDIVDDMIEHNLKFGGDVVFLEKGSLDNFNKIALVTRY